MKIGILSGNPRLYSTKRLEEAAAALGLELDVIILEIGAYQAFYDTVTDDADLKGWC